MAKDTEAPPAEVCPVDPATRAAWLKANSGKKPEVFAGLTAQVNTTSRGNSCDSSSIDQTQPISPSTSSAIAPSAPGFFSRFFSFGTSSPSATTPSQSTPKPTNQGLGLDREISTIPRASPVSTDASSAPANSETESGMSTSGNWVYPSEKMFFEAMKRKGYSSDAKDMKTIVPIHNAVNERAWKEIKEWERPYGSESKCGGPKLHSFLGLSTSLSPRARLNTILGYTAPFDRHDWVVDRCGTKIEYVIDFYAGRDSGKGDGKLNFYLDVRPKLNTFEGCRMRVMRTLGLA